MKVCHITSVHKAHDVRIFEKECISLVKAGFNTSFVVPNTETKVLNGVQVIGVPCTSSGRFSRMINTTKAVVTEALNQNADVYHFHDPELLLFAKKLIKQGAKVIYDAHEDLPRQVLDKPYIPKLLRGLVSNIVEFIENIIIKRHVSAVVAATPYIQKRFFSVAAKTTNVNNYPILSSFEKPANWNERKSEVCYVGGVFKTRGAIEMVKMLSFVETKLHIAGNYSPLMLREEMTQVKGWEKVVEHGFVDREAIKNILKSCKVGLVILHPTESYIHSLPIKMFEYMAAGIPVVASNFPLWQQIVNEYNCGVCVNPFDEKDIASAVNNLLNDDAKSKELGAKGRKAIEQVFNWEKEAEKLVELYRDL